MDDVEDGVAVLVAGGDVEEGELVGPGGVIDLRLLDGIAGIAQLDEVHAFDDATVFDIETRDHTQLQQGPHSFRLTV